MDVMSMEVQNNSKDIQAINIAKNIITKDYLYQLEDYEVCDIPSELMNLEISEYTRLYKFRRIVSNKKENILDKLVTVLNAAYTSNATVITLVKGEKSHTDYYLGVVNKDIAQEKYDIGTQGETFKSILTGNFPGLEIESLSNESIKRLNDSMFVYDNITSISGIASIRNEKEKNIEKYVQGIEYIVDSLQGREYSIIVIADPINAHEKEVAKSNYEELYTNLSSYLKSSISLNESNSVTNTKAYTNGVTETKGSSITNSKNESENTGWNKGHSKGTSENKDIGNALGVLAGGLIGGAAVLATGGVAAPILMTSMYVGGALGSGMIGSRGENEAVNEGTSRGVSKSSGTSIGESNSKSIQNSNTESKSDGITQGKTIQVTSENKTVKNLLSKIDKHIERIEKCEAYGGFNCATYVVSSDPETNAIVSNGYNALMRGDNSSLQASYINSWNRNNKNLEKIKEYLRKFFHPIFHNENLREIIVSPASMANSYELAVNLGMPKRSINGLPVYESASFGRNVFTNNKLNICSNNVNLGEIYHMGSKEFAKVELDLKSLAMHTFITGSTGSGKSNAVYQLIREFEKKNVKCLVIEPAKGEYKHVFGNDKAMVYGSNPYYTPVLKINPFKFPKGIHVLEHIDRIIEIFNVCWPMYAAMPAVLKDSVERAYISAGWNITTSINKHSDLLYPTFIDILVELNNVIEESAFSQEVKDNYIGSLSTRIKSLTNGVYGNLFVNDEIGDEKLFDENVVIDLSRIGSIETKSMIMGILVMRLQEYRMVSGAMNADLKHVTVLEEAHNLLKRTSTEQSGESSNLLGKSVEMLSNAIAEVRTYGEGFIIADQAPGMLDLSVIRNTNTKIIMRLPDEEDRNLVGKAANLSEIQIKELAKLPTGVAAIYQNNWLEPVLCKINYENIDGIYKNKDECINKFEENTKKIIKSLLDKIKGEKLDMNLNELIEIVGASTFRTKIKIEIISILRRNGKLIIEDISSVIYDMISNEEIEKAAKEADSIDEWIDSYVYAENSIMSQLDEVSKNNVIECILIEEIKRFNKPKEYIDTWQKFMKGEIV